MGQGSATGAVAGSPRRGQPAASLAGSLHRVPLGRGYRVAESLVTGQRGAAAEQPWSEIRRQRLRVTAGEAVGVEVGSITSPLPAISLAVRTVGGS